MSLFNVTFKNVIIKFEMSHFCVTITTILRLPLHNYTITQLQKLLVYYIPIYFLNYSQQNYLKNSSSTKLGNLIFTKFTNDTDSVLLITLLKLPRLFNWDIIFSFIDTSASYDLI